MRPTVSNNVSVTCPSFNRRGPTRVFCSSGGLDDGIGRLLYQIDGGFLTAHILLQQFDIFSFFQIPQPIHHFDLNWTIWLNRIVHCGFFVFIDRVDCDFSTFSDNCVKILFWVQIHTTAPLFHCREKGIEVVLLQNPSSFAFFLKKTFSDQIIQEQELVRVYSFQQDVRTNNALLNRNIKQKGPFFSKMTLGYPTVTFCLVRPPNYTLTLPFWDKVGAKREDNRKERIRIRQTFSSLLNSKEKLFWTIPNIQNK